MSNELLTIIARVRRAMPRNQDVMAICDAAEKAAIAPATPHDPTQTESGVPKRFDKKAYQRDLMRKRRSEGKA